MGITIPSNPKLTAGNILCAISLGTIVLLIVGNNYFHDSFPSWLNNLGVVAAGALCIGAPLRSQGKQEQRADFNIALQQKLNQGLAPAPEVGLDVQFASPAAPAPAQVLDPGFQGASNAGGDTPTGIEYCHACGKPNDPRNLFCNNCGTKLH